MQPEPLFVPVSTMLLHADRAAISQLEVAVIGLRNIVYISYPDSKPKPAGTPVVAGLVCPLALQGIRPRRSRAIVTKFRRSIAGRQCRPCPAYRSEKAAVTSLSSKHKTDIINCSARSLNQPSTDLHNRLLVQN